MLPTTPLTLNFRSPFALRGEEIPLDVFAVIAEKVRDGRTLKVLSLVSKGIRSVVAPVLFQRGLALSDKHVGTLRDEAKFRRVLRCSYLPGVKSIRVSISSEKSPTSFWDLEGRRAMEDHRRDLNRAIACLLRVTTQLTSFQWDNGLVMLDSTFRTLKTECKRLTSLNLNFSDEMETGLDPRFDMPREARIPRANDTEEDEQETRPSSPDFVVLKSFSLVGLENLTCLSLETMFGSAKALAAELATVILACPKLELLALSISDQTVELHSKNSYPDTGIADIANFLENVTEHYRASGGKPLPLKELYFGKNVLFWDRIEFNHAINAESDWRADNLGDLVDLKTLEKVEIWNELPDEVHNVLDSWNFGFNAFLHGAAPNLVEVTVEEYDLDFWRFMKEVMIDPATPVDFLTEWEGTNLSDVSTLDEFSLVEDVGVRWPKSFKLHNYELSIEDVELSEDALQNARLPRLLASMKGLESLLLGISESDWYKITTQSASPVNIVLPNVKVFEVVATSPENIDRFLGSVMRTFPTLESLVTATAEYEFVNVRGKRKVRLTKDRRGAVRDYEIIPGPEHAAGHWAWD